MPDRFDKLVRRAIASRNAAEERALSLMLPLWQASLYGEPVLVRDQEHNLLGLGPEVALGEFQPIIVRVSDIA